MRAKWQLLKAIDKQLKDKPTDIAWNFDEGTHALVYGCQRKVSARHYNRFWVYAIWETLDSESELGSKGDPRSYAIGGSCLRRAGLSGTRDI